MIHKKANDWWGIELQNKPDFEMAMKRIYAWYNQEMIDRPPIRFSAHNVDFGEAKLSKNKTWNTLKDKWFDAEFQVDYFIESIKNRIFYAETFPVFWPNLGPEVFAAFYGSELVFQEVTSYSVPVINDWNDVSRLKPDMNNEYFRKIEELTRIAIDKSNKQFMVGYTDIHPGVDCAAAWRDPQEMCIDLITESDKAKMLIELACKDFQMVYDYFDDILKSHNQLSVTWMGIPSFGKMHIPSCDFSAMISKKHFEEFCLPVTAREIKTMTHNVFHVDGKGVAKNLDKLLQLPEINAIQWVQGMGTDLPILQWIPLIKEIQNAGKSVVVDLELSELDEFIENMKPEGLLLCITAEQKIQPDIIKRIEKW